MYRLAPLVLLAPCAVLSSLPSSDRGAPADPLATEAPGDGPQGDGRAEAVDGPGEFPTTPNVLLVVLDDWGVDMSAAYGSATAPLTPTLDGLAAEGVKFRRAYAAPNCSPSRASLMTGMLPHETGIGDVLGCTNTHGLAPETETLAERLRTAGYATGMYGTPRISATTGRWSPTPTTGSPSSSPPSTSTRPSWSSSATTARPRRR